MPISFAIGTNDLTMFTLAIDRADDQGRIFITAAPSDFAPYSSFTAAAARRGNIPLPVCGEIAGDPRYTALLIGWHSSELSMTPVIFPE